ncbi:MAG: alpha-mannosidase [Ruminococcaceae bacterium]|nr:alpha-mannosidase [Oscillospiraceae bacterium]
MNNDARLSALQKKVGGFREVMGFEYSFGQPKEMAARITPVNAHIRRILSELEFALKLDEVCERRFTEEISAAIGVLENAIKEEGVLTKSACYAAEAAIMPLQSAAKEYSVILCAHAHIDMNWMWSWQETVASAVATFTTMLDMMDEYPDFTYSQSQTSVYKLIEDYEPELMERMKKRIAEGRWEITSSAWVETDKNMPTGESLVNTVKYTRDYLQRVWGIDPAWLNIDFSPDTFGHSTHVPEIDTYAGIKYYYHCRGFASNQVLYRFKAPSGSEILMYREPYWYNSGITPHVGIGMPELAGRMGGLKTGMIVYGVGDHGGGPTRRDIERAYEMMEWPIFPSLRFGTFHEFFAIADKPEIREKLPVIDRELNFLFDGCYTTQSRIKRANRMAEAKLTEAQLFSAGASKLGGRYRASAFEKGWQNTLFTHFHDILTGSCVQDSREHAMGLYQSAVAYAETEENAALRTLAKAIDTSMIDISGEEEIIRESQSEGAGVGYGIPAFAGVPNPERGAGLTRVFHIFNAAQCEREDTCQLSMWDWVGDLRRLEVVDVDGNPVEFALMDGNPIKYWDHHYVRILVRAKLPGYGYTTVIVRQREVTRLPHYVFPADGGGVARPENDYVLENEHIRARFDRETMSLVSLIDKADGSEKLSGEFCGLVKIDTEVTGMSAWTIGRHHAVHPVTDVRESHRFGSGALRQGYHWEANVMNSTVAVDVSLDKGAKALRYDINVTWNEITGRFVPLLAFRAPLGYTADGYLCDVPMGVTVRKETNNDVPALTYVAAKNPDGAPLYVMTDCKYGYRIFDNAILSSLINTAHYPDHDPERGKHSIAISIGVGSDCAAKMADISECFVHPERYVTCNPHAGTLAPTGTLLCAETGSARITSVTKDGDATLIRLVELCGKTADVTLAVDAKSARVVNLLGEEIGECTIDGGVKLSIKPYSIVTVELK